MCSWTATSVVDFHNRRGSPVYSAAMNMSKAFDMELFSTLRERKINSIFLRLLAFIYSNQQCNVKWNGRLSFNFSVRNGVRQGAVSSAILFAVYINDLLILLRKSRLGCHIDGFFFRAIIFADDIFLMSASRSGLQQMVNICTELASSKNLKFGTNTNPEKSKTKCLIFS